MRRLWFLAAGLILILPNVHADTERPEEIAIAPHAEAALSFSEILDRVLRSNPTLEERVRAVELARFRSDRVSSNRFPTLSATGVAGRFGSEGDSETYYGFSFPVSYEVDVWGRLRASREESSILSEAAEEDVKAMMVSLTAEIAELYFRGLYLERQIGTYAEAVQIADGILALKREQFKEGLVSSDTVLSSDEMSLKLGMARSDLEKDLVRVEHVLMTMMGEYPKRGWLKGDLYEIAAIKTMGDVIPSERVSQRPDVQAQEKRLEASGFSRAAAVKDLYPKVILSASAANTSLESSQIVESVFASWGAFANISVPVLDGGLRAAQAKEAQSRYNAELASYKKTVLAAFLEVENALSQDLQEARMVEELGRREKLLSELLMNVAVRQRAGEDDFLAVQERHLDLLLLRAQGHERFQRWISSRIRLLRALGTYGESLCLAITGSGTQK